MKITYVGNFSEPWTTESYIARALRTLGHEVIAAYPHHTLERCDVVLFSKPFGWDVGVTVKWIESVARGFADKVACWNFDLLNPRYRDERFYWASQILDHVDLFCTTDGSVVGMLDDPKVKVLRQGIGDDCKVGVVPWSLYECNVLWLGDAYGKRVDLFETLRKRYRARFFHVNDIRGSELNCVMASANYVVSPNWPIYPGYWSNRLYVATGYGGRVVHPRVEGMADEGWIDGENYLGYSSLGELIRILDTFLTLQEDDIRAAGMKLTRTKFTYVERCKELIQWLS